MAKRPKKPDRRVIVSAKVPPELLDRVKAIAGTHRRSVSQMIAILLEGYIWLYDKEEPFLSNITEWETFFRDFRDFELIFRRRESGEQTSPPVSDKKPIKARPHD